MGVPARMKAGAWTSQGTALVTDARLRMTLPIIRSLGRAGISVTVAEQDFGDGRPIIGFHSKYVTDRIRLPRTSEGSNLSFIRELIKAASRVDAVFAVSGQAVFGLASYIESLASPRANQILTSEHAEAGTEEAPPWPGPLEIAQKVALPPLESLRTAHDKAKCTALAEGLGIPVPRHFDPVKDGVPLPPATRETSAESRRIDSSTIHELSSWAEILPYPVIVKYRSGEDLGVPAKDRYRVCRDPGELVRAYLMIHSRQPYPLIEEYIEGEDFGAAILMNRGTDVVASFTYRSIRQHPKAGGPTTYAESATVPILSERLVRLLRALKWHGIAMADFRKDAQGEFRLLEINPRFWGSLALAIDAGVNFPLLYYRLVTGREVRPSTTQKDGVRIRFLPQDLLSCLEYSRTASNRFSYFLGSLADFLSLRAKTGVFDLADPLPGIYYLKHILGKARNVE